SGGGGGGARVGGREGRSEGRERAEGPRRAGTVGAEGHPRIAQGAGSGRFERPSHEFRFDPPRGLCSNSQRSIDNLRGDPIPDQVGLTMSSKSLRAACMLVALGLAAAAQGRWRYYRSPGGVGKAGRGGGCRLPTQPATPGGTLMQPSGTRTLFPPLLIPVNANPSRAIVKQTNGADPKQM